MKKGKEGVAEALRRLADFARSIRIPGSLSRETLTAFDLASWQLKKIQDSLFSLLGEVKDGQQTGLYLHLDALATGSAPGGISLHNALVLVRTLIEFQTARPESSGRSFEAAELVAGTIVRLGEMLSRIANELEKCAALAAE